MKKRILILLILSALHLMLGASVPALAESPRGIVGRIVLRAPWAGGMDIFIDFNVREVNPDTHEATGSCNWKIWHKEWGWRAVDATATCVLFGEDVGGDPQTAILVSRIETKTGWGQGEPGEYAYWWLRDSEEGDQFSINYYRLDDPNTEEDEWYEFFPAGSPPDCAYFESTEPSLDFERGDLTIGPLPEFLPVTGGAGFPDYTLLMALGGLAILGGLSLGLLRRRS